MARFVTGNTFGTTDTVTAATLNTAVNDAAISTDSVDNNTIEVNSNALRLKDSSSKTTGVTFAKMQHISTAQVLGRVSASEGDVEEVGVIIGGSGDAGLLFDNDDMLDNSDTAGGSATRGATQQSIKAYVDAGNADPSRVYNSMSHSTVSGNSQQNTTGRPLWVSFTLFSSGAELNYLLGSISANSDFSSPTRIGQSRVASRSGFSSAGQVTMIVPAGYYWSFSFSPSSVTEKVHSSFIL
jgi:hypothetical protein